MFGIFLTLVTSDVAQQFETRMPLALKITIFGLQICLIPVITCYLVLVIMRMVIRYVPGMWLSIDSVLCNLLSSLIPTSSCYLIQNIRNCIKKASGEPTVNHPSTMSPKFWILSDCRRNGINTGIHTTMRTVQQVVRDLFWGDISPESYGRWALELKRNQPRGRNSAP